MPQMGLLRWNWKSFILKRGSPFLTFIWASLVCCFSIRESSRNIEKLSKTLYVLDLVYCNLLLVRTSGCGAWSPTFESYFLFLRSNPSVWQCHVVTKSSTLDVSTSAHLTLESPSEFIPVKIECKIWRYFCL